MGEVKEMILLARQGNRQAFDEIVAMNTGLVYAVSRRFYHRGCENEDLFQIGMIGLMKAIKRFDFAYDVEFSTYAVPLIMGEIRRFLRDDGMIKVSRAIRENAYKVQRCKERLSVECGREPKVAEIACALDMRQEDVMMAMDATIEVESIYSKASPRVDEENYLIDQLKDRTQDEEKTFTALFLSWGLEQLDEVENQLIHMRYFQDMTQSEVAKRLNMSQVSVSRMEKRILAKLRKNMES